MQKSEEIGITLHLETEVQAIEKHGDGFIVRGAQKGKEDIKLEGNLIVHGAGRIPELEDMELARGNVEREKDGIIVNVYLQSVSNSNVYAAGDAAATPGLPLTPIAGMESQVVASNLLKGNHCKPDYKVMPTVVFTMQQLK